MAKEAEKRHVVFPEGLFVAGQAFSRLQKVVNMTSVGCKRTSHQSTSRKNTLLTSRGVGTSRAMGLHPSPIFQDYSSQSHIKPSMCKDFSPSNILHLPTTLTGLVSFSTSPSPVTVRISFPNFLSLSLTLNLVLTLLHSKIFFMT